ncbi:MAG: PQQ-binding-like beta-propeller repeat protein [Pirellulales bacterium]|nr:PQQ-binding-like beta-propeller repeat protein [Pirellulales bacterium]
MTMIPPYPPHKRRPVRYFLSSLVIAALLFLGAAFSALAANWPEFRGPTADGLANVKNAPTKWSETDNIAWKTPLTGKAWSSPVIWGEQIWLTNAPPDGKEMRAICLDLASGQIVHDIKLWDVAEPQFCYDLNSYASPTPVIEAGRVYVHFGVHGTACLDTTNGEIVWKRPPFDPELQCNHHRGPASSPILHDNLLILTFDGFDQQYVVALDKQSGQIAWRTDRNIDYGTDDGDAKKAYSTPRVIMVDNQPQLISPSAGAVIAYDPRTGEELWRVKCGGMNVSLRPLYAHGLLYNTTAAGGLQLFALKPRSHKPGEKAADLSDQVTWKQEKGASKRSSPIIVGERIYMAGDDGILTCVNALNGEVVWTKRVGGKFSASPVSAAGKIYFSDMEGQTYVLEPGDQYQELAVNTLSAGCMASPAVVEGGLILRTKEAVYRVGK